MTDTSKTLNMSGVSASHGPSQAESIGLDLVKGGFESGFAGHCRKLRQPSFDEGLLDFVNTINLKAKGILSSRNLAEGIYARLKLNQRPMVIRGKGLNHK